MTKNYNEYLEQIKQKLDAMNKASGFEPSQTKNTVNNQSSMPSDDIFDMLGQGAKKWLEKNPPRQDPDNIL
jgi:hypothetical protein